MGGSIGTGSGPYRENVAEQELEWYEAVAPSSDEKHMWVDVFVAGIVRGFSINGSGVTADASVVEYRKRFGIPK